MPQEVFLWLNRVSLQWRHNVRDGVSNHQPHDCLINQRKHQSSASLAFVRGLHWWPLNSPHKGPVTRKMFPFDDVIMEWANCVTRTGLLLLVPDSNKKYLKSVLGKALQFVIGFNTAMIVYLLEFSVLRTFHTHHFEKQFRTTWIKVSSFENIIPCNCTLVTNTKYHSMKIFVFNADYHVILIQNFCTAYAQARYVTVLTNGSLFCMRKDFDYIPATF